MPHVVSCVRHGNYKKFISILRIFIEILFNPLKFFQISLKFLEILCILHWKSLIVFGFIFLFFFLITSRSFCCLKILRSLVFFRFGNYRNSLKAFKIESEISIKKANTLNIWTYLLRFVVAAMGLTVRLNWKVEEEEEKNEEKKLNLASGNGPSAQPPQKRSDYRAESEIYETGV